MFRNQYDTDVTTWSPQGRLFQVEYAMEATKQGGCAVGLKSKDAVVLLTLKRSPAELSSYQKKTFKIDDHIGIALSGLIADGRVLCKFMRNECLNHRYVFETGMPVGRLVGLVADKSQVCTQRSWLRPYGVGLLVAGVDKKGPHLYQTCPSGNVYNYKAIAIGSRSQAAKTYLEKHFESFPDCTADELATHGLKALASSLQEGELTTQNCSLAIVSKDLPFTILEDEAIAPYLDALKDEDLAAPEPMQEAAEAAPAEGGAGEGAAAAGGAAAGGDDVAPMDVEG